MWIVKCKINHYSQSWSILGSYDNKDGAIMHASRISEESITPLIVVTGPNDSVIWSN